MYSQSYKNGTDSEYRVVDLRSDTVSVPTPAMRKAMYEAVVGDDVYNEDPTVKLLERQSAEIFGKEAGLFLPTGTMSNLIAVMTHCNRRGYEAIVGDMAHIFLYEQGGSAQLGGVLLNTIKNNPDGTFCLEELQRKIRGYDLHEPKTSLVLLENTHNMCGGKVLPMDWVESLAKLCKENSLKIHVDGARIFNAIEYLKVSPKEMAKNYDSITFCLSKGLCCPVGSILVGTTDFINEARRTRKALGGGMRQVGFLAAVGLSAFNEIVPNLKDDHLRTRKIAEGIRAMKSPWIQVDLENLHTNILMVQMKGGKMKSCDFAKRLATVKNEEIKKGITDSNGKGIQIKISARDWSFGRIVLYHQITDEDVKMTLKKIEFVIKELDDEIM